MDIKVFHKEEYAEPLEIGMASEVKFTYHGYAPSMNFIGNGQSVMTVPNNHGSQVEVYMEGWKVPAPLSVGPLQFTRNALRDQELRDHRTVIAALVHMLGGAVTVQPDELFRAQRMEVETSEMQDPWYMVIKTKEK